MSKAHRDRRYSKPKRTRHAGIRATTDPESSHGRSSSSNGAGKRTSGAPGSSTSSKSKVPTNPPSSTAGSLQTYSDQSQPTPTAPTSSDERPTSSTRDRSLESLVDGRFYTPAEVGEVIDVKPFTIKVLCRTNSEFCTRLDRNKIVFTKAQATALFNHLANPPKPDPRDPDYDPYA